MANGEITADDIHELVGRVLDGRYVLEKFIDRGGYGAVYLGSDNKFNQPVAVKVGLSSREFMKEARLAAEVKHNHIVHVGDYGCDKGLAYLVMEYLNGEDLEKLFIRQGCLLTPAQLRKLVYEIGDALAYAHSDHLIHRDLKPRNIILKEQLTKSGATSGNSKFVLLDFGIAAKLDADGTQRNRTQDGAGTVEYMAPELLSTDPRATPQSDIYAFGIILYQMMVGRVPFHQADNSHMALAACLNAICREVPPAFREVAKDRSYPTALEELVMQCLEKDPKRRPGSMSELRERFIEIIDHSVDLAATTPGTRSQLIQTSTTLRPNSLERTGTVTAPTLPQSNQRHPSSSRWVSITFSLLFIAVVSALIASRFLVADPFETLTFEHGDVIDESTPLKLTAGSSVALTFAINDLPKDAEVKFEFESAIPSEVLEIRPTNGPIPGISKNFVLSIPDLNFIPQESAWIKLKATSSRSSKTFERTIRLLIERPSAWLPKTLSEIGFREAPDSRRCRIGENVFASVIDRPVNGRSVRFRLIPTTKIGDRTINTFYITESPVTNGVFHDFCKAQPGFEIEPRTLHPFSWEVAEVAEFPVTDVYALEAQNFAWWLAGRQFGTLPSTTEWELAAGYWDFLKAVESKFGNIREMTSDRLRDLRPLRATIPYLGAEVWIGLGPSAGQFQVPNGEVLKGRSPYGCQFPHLKNGTCPTELTSTLVDFASASEDLRVLCQNGIPAVTDQNLNKNYSVLLRGLGPSGQVGDEITWIKGQDVRSIKSVMDLTEDANEFTLLPGDFGKSDYTGFRVVLLTNGEGT